MIKSENGQVRISGYSVECDADFLLIVRSLRELYIKEDGMSEVDAGSRIANMVNAILESDVEPNSILKDGVPV